MTPIKWSAIFAMMMMALSPAAAAEEDARTNESDVEEGEQAWVDDCPPDMMCAYGGGTEEEPTRDGGNASCENCRSDDEPTYSGDCGGEAEPGGEARTSPEDSSSVCAYDNPDEPVSSDEPKDTDGSNCMDGVDEGENCDGDLSYMSPPAEPASGEQSESDPVTAPEGSESGITSAPEDAQNSVPALGIAAVAGLLGAAAIVVARRK